ncbi:MAG: hypothetical protein Q8N23_21325 [Archangium sp.]|nr:hypothetical protein [Archangium sp.]MDP3570895.1 hypothetical protein [Archangium sp.]
MKRLTIAVAVVTSLSVFAQAPAPKGSAPAPKAAPAPAPAAAPAPAPAAAPAPAPAAAAAPAPAPAAMDMSKMGPGARKPTNEAKTKKEIEAWYKEGDALEARKDWDALIARTDFPVFMLTDNLSGVPSGEATSKEAYVAMMKPMWENMPGGTTMKHKLTIAVLSDSLANVVDDFDMTTGKTKVKGRNAMTLVKVAGAWKAKTMTEAGWGDVGAPSAAPAPAPVAAPAPAPSGTRAPPPPPGKAAPAPAPAAPAPAPAPAPKK